MVKIKMEDKYAVISTLIASNILLLKNSPAYFQLQFRKQNTLREEIIQKDKTVR